jgi:hypothetical protein
MLCLVLLLLTMGKLPLREIRCKLFALDVVIGRFIAIDDTFGDRRVGVLIFLVRLDAAV